MGLRSFGLVVRQFSQLLASTRSSLSFCIIPASLMPGATPVATPCLPALGTIHIIPSSRPAAFPSVLLVLNATYASAD